MADVETHCPVVLLVGMVSSFTNFHFCVFASTVFAITCLQSQGLIHQVTLGRGLVGVC